jgi:hypothetical protein
VVHNEQEVCVSVLYLSEQRGTCLELVHKSAAHPIIIPRPRRLTT